jgi:WD40 repeat protein
MKLINTLKEHSGCINALASFYYNDSKYLISSSSNDSNVKVWDQSSNKSVYQLETRHIDSIQALAYENRLNLLAIGSKDKSFSLWRNKEYDGKNIKTINKNHSGPIWIFAILPNSNLVSASWDSSIKIWDSITFELIATLNDHSNGIYGLGILPNSNIISGSWDKTMKIWNSTSFELIATIHDTNYVNSLAVLSNLHIVNGDLDGNIKIWNLESFKLIANLTGHTRQINALVILPNSNIVSASHDFSIKMCRNFIK